MRVPFNSYVAERMTTLDKRFAKRARRLEEGPEVVGGGAGGGVGGDGRQAEEGEGGR